MNSIYDVISRKTLEKDVMQEFVSISTELQDRNVQFPPTSIDTGIEEVNLLLRPLQSMALDLNKSPAQVLLELHHVATQELEDR